MDDLLLMGFVGPALKALVFVLAMSLVREPARREFNAILVAGAGAAYLNGGLGFWEFPFIAVATAVAYLGLRSYRWIGAAWLLHTGWDVVHHHYGNPIWPWQPLSSVGCAVLDALIAVWFLSGAPSVYALARKTAVLFAVFLVGCYHVAQLADAVHGRRAEAGAPPVYAERCSSCHGESGRGDGIAGRALDPHPRNFADRRWQESTSDERIGTVIRRGGRAVGLSSLMAPHGDLSDEQVAALVAYIRRVGATASVSSAPAGRTDRRR